MLKVMIVEDSEFVRAILRNLLLEVGGMKLIGEHADAPAAIEALRSAAPDVVLLDIQLETGNGMDVLKVASAEMPWVKVIMVSNYPEEAFRRRYLAAGAYRFFDKSHELLQLRRLLGELAEAGPDQALAMA